MEITACYVTLPQNRFYTELAWASPRAPDVSTFDIFIQRCLKQIVYLIIPTTHQINKADIWTETEVFCQKNLYGRSF